MRNNNRKSISEEDLRRETKDALVEILGRQPTEKDILHAHAGFKSMAFTILEHLEHEEKKENKQ